MSLRPITPWLRYGALCTIALACSLEALQRTPPARGAALETRTAPSCSSPQPCLSLDNGGTGSGLSALARRSDAVVGQTAAASGKPVASAIRAGLRGEDASKARKGKVDYSGGLLGASNDGFGVWGFSRIHAGVVGQTSNPSAQDQYESGGVEGIDASTDGGQSNAGVLGISSFSDGVQGITMNPSATAQFGRAAVFGIDQSSDGGGRNWGTAGFSASGTGILGISLAGPQVQGGPFTSALLAVCENGGPSIEAADGPLPAANLFLLADCSGNLTLEGTVTTGTPPAIVTHGSAGDVTAYAPREAEATIEDTGRARLFGGAAHVALRADFAATIARDNDYLVFVTAEGDNRGLYVARRTAGGFDVRESAGGTSTLTFAYRIVATPRGERIARLPRTHALSAQRRLDRRAPASFAAAAAALGMAPRTAAP
jgi:hypothetical protein